MTETLDLSIFVRHDSGDAAHMDSRGRGRRLRRLHPQDRRRAEGNAGIVDARLNFTNRRLTVRLARRASSTPAT